MEMNETQESQPASEGSDQGNNAQGSSTIDAIDEKIKRLEEANKKAEELLKYQRLQELENKMGGESMTNNKPQEPEPEPMTNLEFARAYEAGEIQENIFFPKEA